MTQGTKRDDLVHRISARAAPVARNAQPPDTHGAEGRVQFVVERLLIVQALEDMRSFNIIPEQAEWDLTFSEEYQTMLGENGLGPANLDYASSLGDDQFAAEGEHERSRLREEHAAARPGRRRARRCGRLM